MTKVECKYNAKLDLIQSILYMIENEEDLTIDDLYNKLRRSEMFYRNALAHVD